MLHQSKNESLEERGIHNIWRRYVQFCEPNLTSRVHCPFIMKMICFSPIVHFKQELLTVFSALKVKFSWSESEIINPRERNIPVVLSRRACFVVAGVVQAFSV